MALPQTEEHWPDTSGPAGSADWDSLRSDLEALLHKVENSQLRPDAARDNRAAPPQNGTTRARRQAALREVQKAVARFTEPVQAAAPHKIELQAAINEIRARTEAQDASPPPPPTFRMPPPRSASQYKPPRTASDSGAPALRRPDPVAPPLPPEFSPPAAREPMPAAPSAGAPASHRHLPSGRYVPIEPNPGWDEEPLPASLPPRPAYLLGDRNEAIAGLTRLTAAVTGMAGRLEKLETDMHATRDASGDVAEIAAQVGQLTHVVELLAGAVGEQGQVKRLESQIADLARLYSEGPRPEITALTRRFDELGATVDRLAELQVQQIGRANREAEAGSGNGVAMRAIEEGVRNIYDRIDALEATYAVSPEELDRLTREMGGVAEALKHSGDDRVLDSIVQRLDSLSGQIDGMGQVGDSSVSALRSEVDALRDALGEAMAPQFAALESRLESLSNRVGSAVPSPSFAELEEQIRQLARRMDQTGEQLNGLTELYRAASGRQVQPDLEALASMVAESTSREFARLRGDEMGFDQTSLDALEKRLSRLFADNRSVETQGLLNDVTEGLTRVDERLDRLEATLESLSRKPAAASAAPVGAAPTRAASMSAPPKPMPPAAASAMPNPSRPAAPKPAHPAPTFIEPSLSEPSFSDPALAPRAPRAAQQADDMPRPPGTERPLYDDELSALIAPVEDWSVIGLDEPAPRDRKPVSASLPGFDASMIEKPARPRSSLVADDAPGFTPMDEGVPEMAHQASVADEPPLADRNTFIAAARRAARSTQMRPEEDAPHSLIGKAFARFQSTKSAADTTAAPKTPAPKTPASKTSAPPPPVPEVRARLEDFAADSDDRHAPPKSTGIQRGAGLIARHRRTLLLAGTLVAAALLTLNLVAQRAVMPSATTETAILDAPEADPAGAAAASLVDPTPTGSIDPFIKMNLTQPSPTRQVLPRSLMPEPLTDPTPLDPTFTHSVPPADAAPEAVEPAPIKLDLPPEEIGPLDLRQAAADGDARAQFEVGAILTEGRVVPSDFKAAAAWYERSAAQGFAPAQYRLGNLYEHGDGVDTDLDQARLWYTRAAEAGNRLAMHNLASLYASGDLGDQQFAAAAEWFERAADSGMTDSQFNLGMLYARGLGVAQDFRASYKWFALAAEEGDKDAAKSRDDVGRSLSAAELQSVKAEIAAWHMAPINIPVNFAPLGTWSKSFDPGQTIAERPVTEKVQKALARLGYDPGSIDGVMGPKTTEAIKDFEKATGMNPVGLVNPRLLAVLGSQPV